MTNSVNKKLQEITQRVIERSKDSRHTYLKLMASLKEHGVKRGDLSCSNIAHAIAAETQKDKNILLSSGQVNIGIITAYNDMLSAHKPYGDYPQKIKKYAHKIGAVAQVSAGVPAMCDGVTQGTDSMELSLFSRDVIAMSAAVGLSHNTYDVALYLGICDKIVPGLLIAALRFGYLPAIFVPSGPMETGIANKEKVAVRQAYAEGKATRDDLLKVEIKSYHSPGTCTFYGTANSNQMILECLGLQLPGSSFISPYSVLRDELTEYTVKRASDISRQGESISLCDIVNEYSIVNAIVGLLATGGSTNHTIHLIAIARAAGIKINWEDFSDLAKIIPLLAAVYPNGRADVNDFNQSGGVNAIIGELLESGLMHRDVMTVFGDSLDKYVCQPHLTKEGISWGKAKISNSEIVRPISKPFQKTGGLELLKGNIGESIIKSSAVLPKHRKITAPAKVFSTQEEFQEAFKNGELNCNHISVVRFQGPKSNGMPELHKLMPPLGVLQDKGYLVALVTDGRMSGASGKVPSAIHLTPEASDKGMIAKIIDGDLIKLDADKGVLELLVDEDTLANREPATISNDSDFGNGRELFHVFRSQVSSASDGAMAFSLLN